LRRYLGWLKERNEFWFRRRDETIALRREYKKDRNPHNYELDYYTERIAYNDGLVVVEALVCKLIETLENNPFPGEKKRVLDIALECFPEAKVMLQPKVFSKGVRLWLEIFEIGEIDHTDRLRFPVKDEELDVIEVEKLLQENVREDGTILAANIPEILKVAKESKTYRAIRDKLEERGWVWKQRREGGKVVKVVFAPLGVTSSGP
jgi:hypothetical protein